MRTSTELGPAPDSEALDVEGKTVRLSDFRGKPVVLVLMRGFS
jgi:peroxiredoxin